MVVQIPVTNITLKISGDRRACRAVHLSPSASGTNVSFSIDFGDNTSLYYVTESVAHHFPRSGEFVINVTATNLVSTSSQTFVVNISASPCDRLYCDILALEMAFPEKTEIEIASLAWSLLQSSEAGSREKRFNLIWKYLSLFYPVSYSVLKKESTKENILVNVARKYRFDGSHIEIDFILAGFLSSQLKHSKRNTGNESSFFLPYIKNPLETFTWITAVLVSTDEFIGAWNTSRTRKQLCHERLPTPTINNAIDGYILGTQMIDLSQRKRLSKILFDYYCPSSPNVQYSWKDRYKAFYNLSRSPGNDGKWDPTLIASTLSNLTSRIEGYVSPTKEFCLSYFLDVLLSAFNASEFQSSLQEEKGCKVYATCQQCVLGGTSDKCFWCESSQTCLSNKTVTSCNQLQVFLKPPCKRKCYQNQRCSECVSQQTCGWCGSSSSQERSICYESGPSPGSTAMCNPSEWYLGTCASNCPINQGHQCSWKGVCKAGECHCLPGFYGKDCSKRGCVYTIRQNDTLHSVSAWANVNTVDIQMANRAYFGNATKLAINSHLTIPKPETSSICLNSNTYSRFNPQFLRMLRVAKNRAGVESFCGLFGSVASESDKASSCEDTGN